MKKIIICIICVLIIILSVFFIKILKYKQEQNIIKSENSIYEAYLNKQVLGTELTSIINKAINNNEKNGVLKNENGLYIDNEENSVKIEIKMTDDDSTYQMETIYSGGMKKFIEYYNFIYFECTNIKYNKLGKVKYMLFEQK